MPWIGTAPDSIRIWHAVVEEVIASEDPPPGTSDYVVCLFSQTSSVRSDPPPPLVALFAGSPRRVVAASACSRADPPFMRHDATGLPGLPLGLIRVDRSGQRLMAIAFWPDLDLSSHIGPPSTDPALPTVCMLEGRFLFRSVNADKHTTHVVVDCFEVPR